MAELDTSVQYIKGIGEKRAKLLSKLGVTDLGSLVGYFPRAYEDRTSFKPIAECLPDETVCIRAIIANEPVLSHVRRGMELLKFRIVDEGGAVDVTYFNQSYYKTQLHRGESYVFYGRLGGTAQRLTLINPLFEPEAAAGRVTGRIMPVYRLSSGISQKLIADAVRSGLAACGDKLPEALPESTREQYQLCHALYAYENIHFPADYSALDIARRRLIFEELFTLTCALGFLRGRRAKEPCAPLPEVSPQAFYDSLPYSPTAAQRRAVDDALRDMASGAPMNRLVQGDVGSGKTLVAAACIWACCKCGKQAAFMAPTGILAEQHFRTLTALLKPFGMRVLLLTGSMTAKQKRLAREALQSGEVDVAVGTHALLTGDVCFRDLALVITDEQHRFGVEQRNTLGQKGERPHTLVMSATPIPRTLALMIYGELDISVIDELPPGRQKVDTFVVDERYRARLNAFIRKLVSEGRQVFIVCPMVEESEALPENVKSAESFAVELQEKQLPELRIGCIHGRMKLRDKEDIMLRFSKGEMDVLVSTTVIEVGVDVPNAALMIVENADRFGLSQLHQLRGRVGRGQHKSYCVLVSGASSEEARKRLSVMHETTDGFRIAGEDLRIRGPGDFFGQRQHGLPEMRIADFCTDMDVLTSAQAASKAILDRDPSLSLPEHAPLRAQVERLLAVQNGQFN